MTESLLDKFQKSIRRRELIMHGDTVFVACSGGPDSTALFHLLFALRKLWRLKLGLIHFNHGLRRAADADEDFVRRLARRCRVPFLCGSSPVKRTAAKEKFSPEEAARIARYAFFTKEMTRRRKSAKIATAHTQDDQAETVLMRVFQGTGLRGLCAIRPVLRRGKTIFVRPLLEFSKKEILEYLKREKIAYRKDRSNQSVQFLRNRIRLKLMPWLEKEIHPRVAESVARVPAILAEEAEFLESVEKTFWGRMIRFKSKSQIQLSRARFLSAPAPIQFRLIERALRLLDPKSGLSFEAWQKLRATLRQKTFRWSLPKDIDFALTPSKVTLYKKNMLRLSSRDSK